jgi:hypothetical protein
LLDLVGDQPVAQREQSDDCRRELRDVLLAPTAFGRHAHARGHLLLVDIERARALNDGLHSPSEENAIDRSSPRSLKELTSLTGVLMATVRRSGETHTPN